ncbi:RNase adapter RapZ [Parenemella sanctibonifatiensis]|uniref:RNase adaptor protein RapZ n=1 Tax=Parenemella sanctibonifatiensis TaxID=2016505 RepID=A0A255E9Q5_9ACTN|nr:RNase adapter RapZ [Parenemella sanctibonifatiensis]OYN88304.1 RNase adaptor protein RapZ [Parenemella sanctibonifatiensis]OYN89860.1 RNase adaptor protein RapZ [Parenemella sanctibonifatiensis]
MNVGDDTWDAGGELPSELRVVIVSGVSGAGRRTAAHALEDLGWYVVDNLPPGMLLELAQVVSDKGIRQLAVVADVRTRAMFEDLAGGLRALAEAGADPEILFLEASDEVIVRRQESVRRPLPLQADDTLLDGLRRERALLSSMRASADLVIDTSSINVHQLSARVTNAYGGPDEDRLRVAVMSFGFKHGLPIDADTVVDVRFLPNPHWVPELRPHSGCDAPVSEYVLAQPGARDFLRGLEDLIQIAHEGYVREGKRFVTLAVGCTGGRHRSVAMSEAIAEMLRSKDIPTSVIHRDLERA